MPFQLDRELYRKDDSAEHEALREAVVNALVHADRRGQGGVVIERYPDRIELFNPGSLLLSRVQLLPMVSLIPDEVDQALRVRFGDRFAKLDKTAVQAVVTAQVEGSVTNGRMQEITGEHSKGITNVLQNLVRDGLLTQQNQRRWASYRVAEDSPQSGGDSPHTVANSLHWTPELLSLAEPARLKPRLPAAEMQVLVLRLCSSRWLTSKDLATLLSRDAENLQGRILAGLVKKDLLELRFPDVPNRPDQAYRARLSRTTIPQI